MKLKTYQKAILMLVPFAVIQGCASNATIEGMTANPGVTHNQKLVSKVNVEKVQGGRQTNPMWTSQVSNENFQGALVNSLKNAKLYNNKADSEYLLDAVLVDTDQDLFGINLTVKLDVDYNLTGVTHFKS